MHLINPMNKILSILLVWTFLSTNIAYPGTDTLRPMLPFGAKGFSDKDSLTRKKVEEVVKEVKSAMETLRGTLGIEDTAWRRDNPKDIGPNEVVVAQKALERLYNKIRIYLTDFTLPDTVLDATGVLSIEMDTLGTSFGTLEDIIERKSESGSLNFRKYMNDRADICLEKIKSSIKMIENAVASLENWLQSTAVARSAGAGARVDPNTQFQTQGQQRGEQALILYEPLVGAKFYLNDEEVDVELLKSLFIRGLLETYFSGSEEEKKYYFYLAENRDKVPEDLEQFPEVINPEEMLSKLPVSRSLVWGIKRLKSMFPEDKKELTIDDIYWLKPVLRDVDRLAKALIEELLGTGVIEYEEVRGLSGSLSDAFRPFESFSIKRDVDFIRKGTELLEKWYESIPEGLIRQAEATDISGQQIPRSAGAAAGVVPLSIEAEITLLNEQIEHLERIISGDEYELTADDYKLILEVEKTLIELRKDLLMSGILDDAEGGYIKHNLDSAIEILNSASIIGLQPNLRLPKRVEVLTKVRNAIFQLEQAYDRMRRTAIIGQQRKLLIRRYRIPDSSL